VICLTLDVHHQSLGTPNQAASDITEAEAARRLVTMTRRAGVPVTLFVSGRALLEDWETLEEVCLGPGVEVGGHTFECFEPSLLHRGWKKLTGNYNGPRWYESRDVARTVALIEARTGTPPRCWRNHMYMRGANTDAVLAEHGIALCSDGVHREGRGPVPGGAGMLHFPLNVIPDHEHLYHAERTPAWVEWWVRRYDWADDYGGRSYFVHEWVELVLADLERNARRGAVSNLLIHPITMYLCDGFHAFQRILEYLARRPTTTLGALVDEGETSCRIPASR
jgi:hypothetical protein